MARRRAEGGSTVAAVAVAFLVNGAAFGSWVPRIPAIRTRLDLDVATLGAVLLAVGLGGLLGSAGAGRLVERAGSRAATVVAGIAVVLGLPLVAVAPSPLVLAGVLLVLGALDAVTDIGMNVQAVQVQERLGRSVITRFHAVWSLGTLLGGALASVAAASGTGVGTHLLAVGLVEAGLLAWGRGRMHPGDPPREGVRAGAAVAPATLALGAAALAMAVVEGAPADWSAVYLVDVVGADPGPAAVGFVGFSLAMLLGRLAGDATVDRFGRPRTVLSSLALLGLGLVVATFAPTWPAGVAGFTLMGLGVSVLFPLLYGTAGSLPTVSPGAGLAVMSVGARLGFLVGPPAVGLAAGAFGLRPGLALVVGAGLVLTAALWRS